MYIKVDENSLKYYGWYLNYLTSRLNTYESINGNMTINDFVRWMEVRIKNEN
jgi:hypothetical protein